MVRWVATSVIAIAACTPAEAPVRGSADAGAPATTSVALPGRLDGYIATLQTAGEAGKCESQIDLVGESMVADRDLSDDDLVEERRARDTRGRGPMPSPTTGTACAVFGIQKALDRAIRDRQKK